MTNHIYSTLDYSNLTHEGYNGDYEGSYPYDTTEYFGTTDFYDGNSTGNITE
jgi:hypothetical protein